MANQEDSDLLKGQQGESGPGNRPILLGKTQNAGTQAIPDPLKHFLGRRGDQYRLATDAVDLLDPLLSLDDPKDVLCPCWIGRQPKEAHQRGPSLLATVSQQDRPSRATIGVEFLGHRQQMTHRMFLARQSHGPFVAGGMFAEGHVFCRAVGKGQAEGSLLVDCCCDRADIRVVAEDA